MEIRVAERSFKGCSTIAWLCRAGGLESITRLNFLAGEPNRSKSTGRQKNKVQGEI